MDKKMKMRTKRKGSKEEPSSQSTEVKFDIMLKTMENSFDN